MSKLESARVLSDSSAGQVPFFEKERNDFSRKLHRTELSAESGFGIACPCFHPEFLDYIINSEAYRLGYFPSQDSSCFCEVGIEFQTLEPWKISAEIGQNREEFGAKILTVPDDILLRKTFQIACFVLQKF